MSYGSGVIKYAVSLFSAPRFKDGLCHLSSYHLILIYLHKHQFANLQQLNGEVKEMYL